jgi:hypothetical protein
MTPRSRSFGKFIQWDLVVLRRLLGIFEKQLSKDLVLSHMHSWVSNRV